ncbi:MAG: hypothetical protein AVDCRST_MAG20-647, partial [uncultured Acidimicrobiales bacterium]
GARPPTRPPLVEAGGVAQPEPARAVVAPRAHAPAGDLQRQGPLQAAARPPVPAGHLRGQGGHARPRGAGGGGAAPAPSHRAARRPRRPAGGRPAGRLRREADPRERGLRGGVRRRTCGGPPPAPGARLGLRLRPPRPRRAGAPLRRRRWVAGEALRAGTQPRVGLRAGAAADPRRGAAPGERRRRARGPQAVRLQRHLPVRAGRHRPVRPTDAGLLRPGLDRPRPDRRVPAQPGPAAATVAAARHDRAGRAARCRHRLRAGRPVHPAGAGAGGRAHQQPCGWGQPLPPPGVEHALRRLLGGAPPVPL